MFCYCGKVGTVKVEFPQGLTRRRVDRCWEHGKNLVRDIPGARFVQETVSVILKRRR